MKSCSKRILWYKKEWRPKPPQEDPYLDEVAKGEGPKEGEINQNE